MPTVTTTQVLGGIVQVANVAKKTLPGLQQTATVQKTLPALQQTASMDPVLINAAIIGKTNQTPLPEIDESAFSDDWGRDFQLFRAKITGKL